MMGKKNDSLKNTNFNNAIAPMEPTALNSGATSSYVMLDGDIISLDSNEARIFREMVKERFVATNHKRKITYMESRDLWRTFVGNPRREVTRKTKEALISYLYDYYSKDSLSDSTVMDVFNRSQEYRRDSLNRSANTIVRDRQALIRVFDEDFCSNKIKNLTYESISAYINSRSKALHIKERALQDAVRILHVVFDYAMNTDKIIMVNPVSRIDLNNYYQNCDLSMKSSDEKIFTEDEISLIKDRIRERIAKEAYDFIGYAMLFSIATGVRVGEIPVLRWTDITVKGIHIHRQQRVTKVTGQKEILEELPYTKDERRHPKGGRYFPITDEIAAILEEIRDKQSELGIKSEYIFCREDGSWFDKDLLNSACQTNAAPDAQTEAIHTHTHTKIVDSGQIQNSETPINTRHFGI